ncbi:MAG TPA: DUF3303 family protein [Symbiobacteriaceae bacterium]|nr:DUF3303 family protein [Symbiobacteriaceae bacterium]
MLHMVIIRHSPESCPGRPGNEAIHPCVNSMQGLLDASGVKALGRWADPAAHVNYLVLDAPNAHVIMDALMQSGLFGHTTTEIRPVLSMD